MLAKLYRIYVHFFKFLAAANAGVSVLAVSLVLGREDPGRAFGVYVLAVLAKLFGYGMSFVIEKWFFAAHREYFFKNMGLGYRHIFGFLFLADAVILVIIYWLWKTMLNYS